MLSAMKSRRLISRFSRTLARQRSRVLNRWHMTDKEPWVFALVIATIVAAFGFTLSSVFVYKEDRIRAIAAHHAERQDLMCLAHNVYYEARGEPEKGQRAVAEVTMNRVASGRYPDKVCEVVYQKNWDTIRKRYVGAFSWTEFRFLPNPGGEAWKQAWQAAESVYYGTEPPVVEGATHYHANYIKPDWAHDRTPIARIGRHIFYR
jgi:spore germination cell wall hydrolase CwlJ-like protein